MRYRRLLSVTFTLCLFLTAFAVPASSQSPVQTKPSVEFTVLQLNKPIRFLNSNDLPSNIPSGTYQVTAPSPDTLQLTSPSTGEAQNLHATTMTHTESLAAPYVFLIEEAEEQGHMHLILLFPDGQGLDAEARLEPIQSRGIGNMTRSGFTPTQQYSGVVMQQGRVTMDDDFNEQEAISSSGISRLHSKVAPLYGRVMLEQGRLQLDAKARESLFRRCRYCVKKP